MARLLMLYRFRIGHASTRSGWISPDAALGNLAVMLAVIGGFGSGILWLDVVIATIMARVGLWGGCQFVGDARRNRHSGSIRCR
jgi:hypothetical protein